MTTTLDHPDTTGYVVLDRDRNICETAETQTAAFRLVDWLAANDPAAGPYRALSVTTAGAR